MSQIIVSVAGGSPVVPTNIATQDGNAIPAANVLIIDAFDSTEDDADGITTKGGAAAGDPPGTGAGNEVSIYLTNRITGTAITTDAATPQTVYSFSLGATPATYMFDIKIIAYNVTDILSAGYSSTSVIKTTGAVGSEINADPGLIAEEGTMSGVVVQNQITGNNIEVIVTGLAGKTINWEALTTYFKVT